MALPRLRYDTLILDGLFLTQKDVEWVLSVYLDNPKFFENFKVEKIIIDYWTPDKQACLWNDRGRRSIDSKKSIDENIIRLFFRTDGYLYDETRNLLTQEFSDI